MQSTQFKTVEIHQPVRQKDDPETCTHAHSFSVYYQAALPLLDLLKPQHSTRNTNSIIIITQFLKNAQGETASFCPLLQCHKLYEIDQLWMIPMSIHGSVQENKIMD